MVVTNANVNTKPPVLHLDVQSQSLLQSALSKSTGTAYTHSWKLLMEFCDNRQLVLSLPLSSVLICNFIGYLFAKAYSPSTITSHVSALSYIHKVLDIDDQSNSFIARKMLKGCDNVHGSVSDSRLPITKPILKQMLAGLERCVVDVAIQLLLEAVFLLAFSEFLRLGEILIRSKARLYQVVHA